MQFLYLSNYLLMDICSNCYLLHHDGLWPIEYILLDCKGWWSSIININVPGARFFVKLDLIELKSCVNGMDICCFFLSQDLFLSFLLFKSNNLFAPTVFYDFYKINVVLKNRDLDPSWTSILKNVLKINVLFIW